MSPITVEAIIANPIDEVWKCWTSSVDIQQWNHASNDWECPYVENDMVVGGRFLYRMSAKDGSVSFDFTGIYTSVIPYTNIEYSMMDGRKVSVRFEKLSEKETKIVEIFDPEGENSPDLQRSGWQAILNNFKLYIESRK